MIKHYLKVAVRNLVRNRTFSLINILGLAVGMGVCLLIYQYIHFEMSFDKFHSNADNTYRIVTTNIRNKVVYGTSVGTGHALGLRAKEDIPEIKHFVRTHPQDGGEVVGNSDNNSIFKEDGILFVDHNFLHMFDFPLTLGDKESALDEKHSIVITEQTAKRYFGTNNPIGKILKINGGRAIGDFTVTGVLKALPINSHLQFDFLLPLDVVLDYGQYKGKSESWGWTNFVTYISIDDETSLDNLAEKFDQVVTTYAGELLANYDQKWEIGFQPIAEVHLRSGDLGDTSTNIGDIQEVWFFSIIAIFILIMAWINYINLSTALALHKAKEVSIRKSIGAFKMQLVSQFMLESGLINAIAALLSFGIVFLTRPILTNIIGVELELSVLQNVEFWVWFCMIIILGSIVSGLYPAFVLSSFKPVGILRSVKVIPKGGFNLRKGLIVFQFLMSALLISGTYLVYQQIAFMKNKDLGIDMEKILVLNGPGAEVENMESKLQTFKTKALTHNSIYAVSGSGSVPGRGVDWVTSDISKMGEQRKADKPGHIVFVGYDFTNTYDFHFLSGEPFNEEISTARQGVIINEEAVKFYELGSPENALQEKLIIQSDTLNVRGVIKNVHWNSLKDAQSPHLFWLERERNPCLSVKMNLDNIQESIAHIELSFNAVFPNNPFGYFFLEDEFNRQYKSDLQFGNLFSAFSVLAIIITCLGLFALVSYLTMLRVKEIGIRKVLGASIGNLMMLLCQEYVVLLLFGNILAIPVIVYWGGSWLDNFAFRTGLGIEAFIIPAFVLIVISLFTVGFQTYTSARSNPVDSLKAE